MKRCDPLDSRVDKSTLTKKKDDYSTSYILRRAGARTDHTNTIDE